MSRAFRTNTYSALCCSMCAGAVLFLLAACQLPVQLNIVTNASPAPIVVRYAFPPTPDADACTWRPEDPRVGPTPANPKRVSDWQVNSWNNAPRASWNADQCEMKLTLDPGHSAMITRYGNCDDRKRPDGLADPGGPSFRYLIIESARGATEWRGWDVAKQFRRLNRNVCVYRFAST